MKIPYNILIQIKMSVRPYFKGFTLIFFFYNCRKQDCKQYWKRFQYLFYFFFAALTGNACSRALRGQWLSLAIAAMAAASARALR